jgi:multicomponent Na+:H+ antiporter subunit D
MAGLGSGCVAFGVLPYAILRHVAEPAAGGLLAANSYARGVLSAGSTNLPVPTVHFAYLSAQDLLTAIGTFVAGLVLAAWYIRSPEPRPVAWLRAVHNGSINDYASYLAVGGIVTVAALLVR